MGVEGEMNTALYMAAIDGGYCCCKKDDKLTILYASPRVGKLLGTVNVSKLTDYMSPVDRDVFFDKYKPNGNFSVRCNLIFENRLIPTTLKCNSANNFIYVLITTQLDWYKYATTALQAKKSYDRLLDYTASYLFECDLEWNIVSYTTKMREIFPLDNSTNNLAVFLTDDLYIDKESQRLISKMLNANHLVGKSFSENIRVNTTKGWHWLKIDITPVINRSNNSIEAYVGSFQFIDSTGSESRKDKDSLAKCFNPNYLNDEKIAKTLCDNSWLMALVYKCHRLNGAIINDKLKIDGIVADVLSNNFKASPGMLCYENDVFYCYFPNVTKSRLSAKIEKVKEELNSLGQFEITAIFVHNSQNNMDAFVNRARTNIKNLSESKSGKVLFDAK